MDIPRQDSVGTEYKELTIQQETPLKSQGISPLAKGTLVGGSTLAVIGVTLGVIEAVMGAGTLAGAFAAAGGAIAAGFSALAATIGPFLASAVAVIGGILATVSPIALAAIIGGVIVAVAIAVVIHLAIKNSRTTQVIELLSKQNRTEEENNKLAGHLRNWAEEGEVKNLKNLLKGKGGEQIDHEIFFQEDSQGNSVMSTLIDKRIYELFSLFKDREINKESTLNLLILDKCQVNGLDNDYSDDAKELLIALAKHNLEYAKEIVKETGGQDTSFGWELCNATTFGRFYDATTAENSEDF